MYFNFCLFDECFAIYKSNIKKFSKMFFLFILLCLFKSPCFSQNNDIVLNSFSDVIFGLEKEKRASVGLALSGGGARGFAHVGVIEVIRNSNMPIDYIAGTSMGAIVGAFYALDYDMDSMWDFGKNISKYKISKDFSSQKLIKIILTGKLSDPLYVRKFIDNHFAKLKFSDLKIPFGCVAMDINSGEKIIFDKGDLSPAVKASVNIPGIFSPLEYKSRYLVDGGVVDFLPVDVLKDFKAEWILSSVTENKIYNSPKTVIETLMQVIDIRGNLISKKSEDESDFILKPDVSFIKAAEFDKSNEAALKAVPYTYNRLNSIKERYVKDNFLLIIERI